MILDFDKEYELSELEDICRKHCELIENKNSVFSMKYDKCKLFFTKSKGCGIFRLRSIYTHISDEKIIYVYKSSALLAFELVNNMHNDIKINNFLTFPRSSDNIHEDILNKMSKILLLL